MQRKRAREKEVERERKGETTYNIGAWETCRGLCFRNEIKTNKKERKNKSTWVEKEENMGKTHEQG
jgi:hypothetical protein